MLNKTKARLRSALNHPGFQRYAGNTTWLLIEKVLRLTAGMFVGIWVARYLGPEYFGSLSYAQSVVFLFSAIATLGLDAVVVRELVKGTHDIRSLLGTACLLKLAGALVMIFIVTSVAFLTTEGNTRLMIMLIAFSWVFQCANVIDFYCQAKVLSKYVAWINTACLAISSLVKVYLILSDASVVAFAATFLLDAFILAFGLIFFFSVYDRGNRLPWSLDIGIAKVLLKESWPLMLSGVVVSLYMQIDQIMIKEMLTEEAVGHYAAAVRLSEAWYFIPTVIAGSLFPAILNARNQGQEFYHLRLQRFYTLMTWLALAIALPVTFLSDWIIETLYGSSYSSSASVLEIHIWSGVFVFLTVSSGKYLVAENMANKVFVRNCIGAVANVILNFIFIPYWGIEAAAATTLISWALSGYLYDLFDRDMRFMFRMKSKSFIGAWS